MLCDKCKNKQATVHIKHIGPEGIKETHLCDICAKEEGQFKLSPQISFQKFFPQFFNITQTGADTDVTCPACGTTLSRLSKSGKPGCAQCYITFGDSLRPLLKRIHANSQHTGKMPGKSEEIIQKDRKIASLQAELNKAVKEERFEEAAVLRDKIRVLRIEQDTILKKGKSKDDKNTGKEEGQDEK